MEGRSYLLSWVNSQLSLNLTHIEQCASGAVYLQLIDKLYNNGVPMQKVNWNARFEYEFVSNYKVLQSAFEKLKIDKKVEVSKLIKAKLQDNLEFLQWIKAFSDKYQSKMDPNQDIQPYDPQQRRKISGTAMPNWAKPSPQNMTTSQVSEYKNLNNQKSNLQDSKSHQMVNTLISPDSSTSSLSNLSREPSNNSHLYPEKIHTPTKNTRLTGNTRIVNTPNKLKNPITPNILNMDKSTPDNNFKLVKNTPANMLNRKEINSRAFHSYTTSSANKTIATTVDAFIRGSSSTPYKGYINEANKIASKDIFCNDMKLETESCLTEIDHYLNKVNNQSNQKLKNNGKQFNSINSSYSLSESLAHDSMNKRVKSPDQISSYQSSNNTYDTNTYASLSNAELSKSADNTKTNGFIDLKSYDNNVYKSQLAKQYETLKAQYINLRKYVEEIEQSGSQSPFKNAGNTHTKIFLLEEESNSRDSPYKAHPDIHAQNKYTLTEANNIIAQLQAQLNQQIDNYKVLQQSSSKLQHLIKTSEPIMEPMEDISDKSTYQEAESNYTPLKESDPATKETVDIYVKGYNEIVKELESSKALLQEKISLLDAAEENLKNKENIYNALNSYVDKKEEEFKLLQDNLQKTENYVNILLEQQKLNKERNLELINQVEQKTEENIQLESKIRDYEKGLPNQQQIEEVSRLQNYLKQKEDEFMKLEIDSNEKYRSINEQLRQKSEAYEALQQYTKGRDKAINQIENNIEIDKQALQSKLAENIEKCKHLETELARKDELNSSLETQLNVLLEEKNDNRFEGKFYYYKLRQIEMLCELDEYKNSLPTQTIFDILISMDFTDEEIFHENDNQNNLPETQSMSQ